MGTLGSSVEIASSVALFLVLMAVLVAHAIRSATAGRSLTADRVMREEALPLVGKAPMHAVARSLEPLGRLSVRLGISANAVSIAALAFAMLAAVAFSRGMFGSAAVLAAVASLADGLDGMIARLSNSQTAFGRVLDTTIDRYVDALFLGAIAVYVRESVVWLVLALSALVGAFAVSYASSVERELGVTSPKSAMRRAHRLSYLIAASALAPLAELAVPHPRAALAPVMIAVSAIALFGNVSAVRRLLLAGRAADRERSPEAVHGAARGASAPPHSAPHAPCVIATAGSGGE